MLDYFLSLNEQNLAWSPEIDVISFSHFLPRLETMVPSAEQLKSMTYFTQKSGFNFSRVAGSARLDQQIRRANSAVHVYGHQHRNRCRFIDGIYYASCCLGYERERSSGSVNFPGSIPLEVWNSDRGVVLHELVEDLV